MKTSGSQIETFSLTLANLKVSTPANDKYTTEVYENS